MKDKDDDGLPGGRSLNVPAPTINVTPLVDVLLVLLIIFFVIQPQREAKFESRIPQKPPDDVLKGAGAEPIGLQVDYLF